MSIEWDSTCTMLADSELKTVGSATENARRANSVRSRGTDNSGAPAKYKVLVRRATGRCSSQATILRATVCATSLISGLRT